MIIGSCPQTMSFAVLPSCHSMPTSLSPKFLLSVILCFVGIDGGNEEHSIAASFEVAHVVVFFARLAATMRWLEVSQAPAWRAFGR